VSDDPDPYPTRVPTTGYNLKTTLDQLTAQGALILGMSVESSNNAHYLIWVAWPGVRQQEMKI